MSDYNGKLAELYVEITARVDALRNQLDDVTKTAQRKASEMQGYFSGLKLGFDNHVMTLKISEVETAYKKLKAELDQKIALNVDMGSIEETKIKLSSVERALSGVKSAADTTGEHSKGFAAIWANVNGQLRASIGVLGEMAVGLFTLKKAFDIGSAIVTTSAEFEKLRTRLNALYNSAEIGGKIFEKFKVIAQTTPFSLREVTESGATLKSFGMDAEKTIKITADLAAYMGVSMPEAASSMGRAFAGGVGAADIFRERGVLNLIKSFKGITDLTKLTLPEFRQAMMDTFVSPTSGIAGATDALSKTFQGAMSNMGDAIDQVYTALGDSLLPTLTKGVLTVTDFLSSLVNTDLDNTINQLRQYGVAVETINRLTASSTLLKNFDAKKELQFNIQSSGADAKRVLSGYGYDADNQKKINANIDFLINPTTKLADAQKLVNDYTKQYVKTIEQVAEIQAKGQSNKGLENYGNSLKTQLDRYNAIYESLVKIDALNKQNDEAKKIIDNNGVIEEKKVKPDASPAVDLDKLQKEADEKAKLLKEYYDQVKWFSKDYNNYLEALLKDELKDLSKVIKDKDKLHEYEIEVRKDREADYQKWLKENKVELLHRSGIVTDTKAKDLYSPKEESAMFPFSNADENKAKGEAQNGFNQVVMGRDLKQWQEENKMIVGVMQSSIDVISSSWGSAVSNWIAGGKSFTETMKGAFENMASQIIGQIAEIGMKWAIMTALQAIPGIGPVAAVLGKAFGFANGGDFIVPPGYNNDSFPMWVQTGEHVSVTPAGQSKQGDSIDIGPLVQAITEVKSSIQAMNVNLVQKDFSPVIVNRMDGKSIVRDVTRPAEQTLSRSGAKQI